MVNTRSVSCGFALLLNPDHLEVLRQGVRAWNSWRANNCTVIPDLHELAPPLGERQFGRVNGGPINLRSALLSHAFLRFATLTEADLGEADLSEADLVHARLDRANLSGADLQNARLDHADFFRANLNNAKLAGASLENARNLSQEQLERSIGDETTVLPAHLRPPKSWRGSQQRVVVRRFAPAPEQAAFEPAAGKDGPVPIEVNSTLGTNRAKLVVLAVLLVGSVLSLAAYLAPSGRGTRDQVAAAPQGEARLVATAPLTATSPELSPAIRSDVIEGTSQGDRVQASSAMPEIVRSVHPDVLAALAPAADLTTREMATAEPSLPAMESRPAVSAHAVEPMLPPAEIETALMPLRNPMRAAAVSGDGPARRPRAQVVDRQTSKKAAPRPVRAAKPAPPLSASRSSADVLAGGL